MSNTIANTNRKMEMMLIIVGFLIYASKGGPKKNPITLKTLCDLYVNRVVEGFDIKNFSSPEKTVGTLADNP
jgi:hypothetical protein